MSTWTVITDQVCKRTTSGSMGRMIAVNDAIDIYNALRKAGLVMDLQESENDQNKDEEIKPAVSERGRIAQLRAAEVIK
jgi:hypothetical protein